MNYAFVAVACAMLAGCALALQLPDVKDQPDKPIDPKQIKNATLTFYNNGTYVYILEVPCEAYLTPGRGGQNQQRGSQSQLGNAHDEEDDEHEDDEDANGQQQTPQQQRQRQQQQQQRQRQQQQRSRQPSSGGSQQDHHMNPDELRQAHEGTECECQCKNQEGEELDDIITVSFGGKGGSQHGVSQQRGNQRQQQQQRQRQQQQRQQQQRQRSTVGGSQSGQEGEGPELVYPQQPRAGQKCIFFEEGEWENDDDELIDAVGPDHKTPGEPEDEVLEKCTFNFKKGGAGQQQQSSSQGGQQVSLQCVDNHGDQDQYVVRIVNGELKPKLTPQQKQEQQQQNQQKSQQGRNRPQKSTV